MKIALKGNAIYIRGADNVQFTIIKSWNKMKWNKKLQQLEGVADLELLDKLSGIIKLPTEIESRRTSLRAVQEAVDRERMNPNPVPIVPYPVRLPLYRHQVRAANMALMVLGLVDAERSDADAKN